jgi:hypothetical protein
MFDVSDNYSIDYKKSSLSETNKKVKILKDLDLNKTYLEFILRYILCDVFIKESEKLETDLSKKMNEVILGD